MNTGESLMVLTVNLGLNRLLPVSLLILMEAALLILNMLLSLIITLLHSYPVQSLYCLHKLSPFFFLACVSTGFLAAALLGIFRALFSISYSLCFERWPTIRGRSSLILAAGRVGSWSTYIPLQYPQIHRRDCTFPVRTNFSLWNGVGRRDFESELSLCTD